MNKLKRAVIKEEYVEITGNYITALILNQFVYWSERVKDFDNMLKEEKEMAKKDGIDINLDFKCGWIYKKTEELSEELMLGTSKSTMRQHIKKLIEMELITERRNPNYKWDRTLQYRVNFSKINEMLKDKGYLANPDGTASSKIELRSAEFLPLEVQKIELRSDENRTTIPETTTEINKENNITHYVPNIIPEKNSEVEKIDTKNRTVKKFVPPTVKEVETYCKQRNNNINANAFCNSYEAKGWLIGKTPMKDWKAAVRTWENKQNQVYSQTNKTNESAATLENQPKSYDLKAYESEHLIL